MKNNKLTKLCITAMLSAVVCVSTILIQIPSPTGGYINPGDGFIMVSSILLPPHLAFGAGSLGSALADIFSGYTIYAPATFIIKGLMALVTSFLYRALLRYGKLPARYIAPVCAIPAEIIMILGYYLFGAIISGGFIPALQTILPNVVQGVMGILCGTIITFALKKAGITTKINGLTMR